MTSSAKPAAATINIPNILTLIRILLTPLFVLSITWHLMGYALFVFAMAAATDALDGLLARWLNQRTLIGAYLDPLADKLLSTAAFVSLSMVGIIPVWLAVIVISRDLLILMGIAVLKLTDVPFEMAPSTISKGTTLTQMLAICLVLLAGDAPFLVYVYAVTAAMTVVSGLQYIYRGMNLLQSAPETGGRDDFDHP
jgi:cardiolipin synthase